jgi:PAS domain S-box-containing protein
MRLDQIDEALDRVGDGAFAIDGAGRIVAWNRTAHRILGYRPRDVVGRRCCEVFVGYDEDGNRLCYQGCRVRALVHNHEPIRPFDMRTRMKSGRPVWLNISVLPLPPELGGLIIQLFRDVSSTKELLTLVHERLAAAAGRGAVTGGADLTRRELEVLRLMARGVSSAAAAERLHLSRKTIGNHAQNILGKLGVHSRLEAVAYAYQHRLL